MERISSVNNQHIKDLAKLNTKKYRKQNNLFLVEGYHLVEEAYKKGFLVEVLSLKEEIYPGYIVTEEIIKKLSDSVHPQGIIGVCKLVSQNIKSDNILILDDISDPGNLGTLLRSALAFNYKKVILSENSCDIYNPKVLRASQGAIFYLDIEYVGSLEDYVKSIKNEYKVYATSLNGQEMTEFKKEKNAIILGNEARGVRESLIDMCETLKIPINEIESLNVSIAGSIIMYMLKK